MDLCLVWGMVDGFSHRPLGPFSQFYCLSTPWMMDVRNLPSLTGQATPSSYKNPFHLLETISFSHPVLVDTPF